MNNSAAEHKTEIWASRILRIGVVGSSALMVLGLLQVILNPAGFHVPAVNPSFRELTQDIFSRHLDATSLMYLGLISLMLTPVLRVCTTFVGFFVERDWKFVLISLVVFLMLATEIFFSSH